MTHERINPMYGPLIGKATGETDPHRINLIEECMRQDIFHSTLDWQTRRQLQAGARKAKAVLEAAFGPTLEPSATQRAAWGKR